VATPLPLVTGPMPLSREPATGQSTESTGPDSVSIVIPVLNERDTLEPLHGRIVDALGRLESPFEIILINDGSDDGSAGVADEPEVVDLTVALSVGMVLAAFLFMRRMAEVSSVQAISREMLDMEDAAAPPETLAKWRGLVPRGVEVYDVNGPFFFGAAETFTQYLHQVSAKPKAIILDLEGVPAMDSTGLRALTTIVARRHREHVAVFLVGLQEQPRNLILRSPLADMVGREYLSLSAEQVVAMIRERGLMITTAEQALKTS